jgi:16S rRNA (cytosine1402-N4)-methyltransferase
MKSIHKSVLLKETVIGLNLPKDGVVVDGTFGGGGHSQFVSQNFPEVKIIAIDQDKGAWEKAKDKFTDIKNVVFHNNNFREIKDVLEKDGLEKVDGIILDLGLSSDQLDASGRGFSFMRDEPLLMTIKENPSLEDITAKDIVNSWKEENLADIIYGYGEEQFSRRIAKGIVEARKIKPIETTIELVEIINKSVPNLYKKGKINPATKTFQALRIAVNDELGAIEEGLNKGFEVLKSKRRMSVISFHSLEDRIVKRFFKEKEKNDEGILITKKPIIASEIEIKENPRSRSAKLRIIEKI